MFTKKVVFVIILIMIFSFFKIFAAWYQWDISGWLKEKYMQSKSDERFKNLAKDYNFANLYKNMYQQVWVDQIRAEKDSISRLKEFLAEKGCAVSDSDLSMIFNWLDFWDYTKFLNNPNSISWEMLKNICSNILTNCFHENINEENTMWVYSLCYLDLMRLLMFFRYHENTINLMKEDNIIDDVLMNWDPKDWPYDLLVDIYEIKKILFQNDHWEVKKPKIIKFYSGSSWWGSSFWWGWGEQASSNSSNWAFHDWNMQNNNFWNNNNKSFSNQNWAYNQNNLPFFSTNQNTNSYKGFEESFNKSFNWSSNNQINNSLLKNNTQCMKSIYSSNLNLSNKQGSSSFSNKTNYSNTSNQSNFNNSNSSTSQWIKGENSFSNNSSKFKYSAEKDLLNKLTDIFNLWSQAVWWGDNDKWLCSSSYNDDKILWVSICLIPSGVKIPPKMIVYSIEDMLNQILRVLEMAKDSWQLMKHAYSDESWETALQDIKLDRIFVFDIVMMKKPLFPNRKRRKKAEKDKEKALYKDLNHHFWIQLSDDLEDKKEKNKYVVLWPSKGLYFAYDTREYDPQFVQKIEEEKLSRNLLEIFYDFLNKNIYYWWQINDLLLDIRKSSMYLFGETNKR